MRHADHDTLSTFDRDLDALVTGTPARDHASNGTTDPATSSDLHSAARRFHGLAARADRRAEDTATQRTLDAIWEHLMDAQLQPPAPATAPRLAGIGSPLRTRRGRILAGPRPSPWQVALNGVLAAALIIAIAAGLWRAYDVFGPAGGGDPEPIRFSAMGSQGEEDFTPDPVPTADECTVEPLTVDEVMAPFETFTYLFPPGTPVVPVPTPVADDPLEDPMGPYPRPEPSVIQEVVAAQRMWLACMIAGDPFRVWAMESDIRIVQSIGSRYYGGYSQETIRADLEAIKENGAQGTRFELPTYSDSTFVPMVMVESVDIYHLYNSSFAMEAALYWTTVDGSLAGRPGYLTEEQYFDPTYAPLRDQFAERNNTGIYVYSAERQRWLFQGTDRMMA